MNYLFNLCQLCWQTVIFFK